jgi:hypothetical protein
MQLIALAPEQPSQERHPAFVDCPGHLCVGETVNLQQDKTGLIRRSLRHWQVEQSNCQTAAIGDASKPSPHREYVPQDRDAGRVELGMVTD